MISKKWRNLDKNLIENYKNNKNDEINIEDNNYKREIIIVDVFNGEEEDEIQEKDNKEKKEIILNRSELKLPKSKPILNVDPNSINLVNYIVNNKNDDLYKKYSNYYRGYDTRYQYQPRNYTYYCTSHFNSKNNTNKQVNYLTRGNDYTYNYTSRYNIINKRNYNQPYKLNKKNNITYADYLKEKYKNNSIYSQNFVEKPNYIKPISIRKNKTINNHENLKKNKRNLSDNQRINRSYSWRNLQGERNTYVINDFNNNLQPVILIENKNRNNNSIDSKINYIYI